MNKKLNTVLFILGALLFNLITMAVLFSLGFVIATLLIKDTASQVLGQFMTMAVLILAVGGTFFIYHGVLKWLDNKITLNRFFEPFFKSKKTKKRRQ